MGEAKDIGIKCRKAILSHTKKDILGTILN